MDFVRQFFSLSVNPADWLGSLGALTAITLVSAAVFMVGCARLIKTRKGALALIASGLVVGVIGVPSQYYWFQEAMWSTDRAVELWFYSITVTAAAVFLAVTAYRMSKSEASTRRFVIGAGMLCANHAAFMIQQVWNEQTLADYANCLNGMLCDVDSARDGLITMPLWLLTLHGLTGLCLMLSPVRHIRWRPSKKTPATA